MAKDQLSAAAAAIQSLDGSAFVTLHSRLDRGGALQARKLANGAVQLYWRYSYAGKTSREPIGVYDPTAPPKKLQPTVRGYGIAAALEKCRALAEVHVERANTGGLQEAKAEKRKAFLAKKAEETEKSTRTLEKLLDTYVEYLKAQGRRSHVDAQGILQKHVTKAWPAVAKAPAVDLTPDQVLDMLRCLIESGKGRTANKLRSYLRAAYQCALDVRTLAAIPVAFKTFAVTFNPAAQTRRSPQFDRADKRPLTLEEMKNYWGLISARPGPEAAALRLHLLTGGQRIEQFIRLRWADVGDDVITLFDGKGRPSHGPRPHQIPLVPLAVSDMKQLSREGEFVFSTTHGKKPISSRTLTGWAHGIVGAETEGFQLKRIRSGVETLLAREGVSREVRGHLQSHGLTGVQARHYDGHDYIPEKRHALGLLVTLVCVETYLARKR
ncbi:tyrosine-type recombinase/integrase [Hydrogenophaga luteola]|uniref:Tyrosine-type recombinase/integrase n=1 Tax=Hydrogenophaga luteola TaxID=1591122 RepID=A0ABV7W879_9BURK